jgi:hypothetical protein
MTLTNLYKENQASNAPSLFCNYRIIKKKKKHIYIYIYIYFEKLPIYRKKSLRMGWLITSLIYPQHLPKPSTFAEEGTTSTSSRSTHDKGHSICIFKYNNQRGSDKEGWERLGSSAQEHWTR